MAIDLVYPPGATPLSAEEADGLIPSHITTQGQLNEWEAATILEAQTWASTQWRIDTASLLTEESIRKLHKRMFASTWKWAGTFRNTEKNIGVHPVRIATSLTDLCRDTAAQLEYKAYEADEIAARFHHRLVFTHAFPNGNGRHARLMADLLLQKLNRPFFDWGNSDLIAAGEARRRYIAALQRADAKDYSKLLAFVRSGAGG